jgi:tetratricopeptide (TPR) repeat protein
MPKSLTQYRVFIGSPGGLEGERQQFRDTLARYTERDAEPRGVIFHPVGWEDSLGGVGRPQAIINEDLAQCDYAIFVLHDRWGSPTGNGHTSGTEEEWTLAERLYEAKTLRNMALFFKRVEPRQLREPGEQLKKVIDFKNRIEAGKRHLFWSYGAPDQFCQGLEKHLAKWLRDHEGISSGQTAAGLVAVTAPAMDSAETPAAPPAEAPGFDYWISRVEELLNAGPGHDHDYTGALFCAERANATAVSDLEWARAQNSLGVVQSRLNRLTEAIASFTEVGERFKGATDANRLAWQARASVNRGLTLGQLGRGEDAIAVYDDVLARFGTAAELPLRERVAKALLSKSSTLVQLGRRQEAIAVCDDLLARFGTAAELPLRERVAKALVNKGLMLGELGRGEDEIAAYDDVLARFGAAPELPLREQVANALFNKGFGLGELGRGEDEIAAYDEVLIRFGAASELALREQVAKALVNKGLTLGELGRSEDAVRVYDDVFNRFGTAPDVSLRGQVAEALVNKAAALGELGRGEDANAVYDDVLARFGKTDDMTLKHILSRVQILSSAPRPAHQMPRHSAAKKR